MRWLAVLATAFIAGCSAAHRSPPMAGGYLNWHGEYRDGQLAKGEWSGNSFLNATFVYMDFGHAAFRLLDGDEVQFRGSDLSGMDLRGMNLRNSGFSHSRLDGADLRGSSMKSVGFRESSLKGVDLRGSVLLYLSFPGSDLSGADLRDVKMIGCNLEGTKFDARTRLPFSREEALRLKMVEVR